VKPAIRLASVVLRGKPDGEPNDAKARNDAAEIEADGGQRLDRAEREERGADDGDAQLDGFGCDVRAAKDARSEKLHTRCGDQKNRERKQRRAESGGADDRRGRRRGAE